MTTVLRELINGPGVFPAPGVYDPITARIAEQVGFKALDLPGSALGYATCMMEPNLSLEDMADATRKITSTVNIPIIVDVGAGFGEPAHVLHTVRLLEHAGAAGIHIEDQIYPKRFHYHRGLEHIIPAEAMLDKVRCALEARRDPDFVIVARTDAIRTHGFAEGVRRANLYLEAGAQMIMMFPKTGDEVRQLPKEVRGPINWTQTFRADGGPPFFSLQELEALGGYKVINYAGGPMLAAYKAVKDMLTHLMNTGTPGMDPQLFTSIVREVQESIGVLEYYRVEEETVEKTEA
ncbi:MAG TPA: isocitrate lyase/PEP mutase family protein [Candidatus Dormibacteraeota bacterium]|nr:isocitrate lyase/PEP mutase family protein [Candidatus Dormibacteraeota bacterium]